MYCSTLVWTAGFGFADLESRVRATPQTRFRVGSISKALTSAALGRLLEEGRLDLDAPVRELVPEYPDQGHPITSRQLAAHLSGIPHYEERDLINRVHYGDVIHALDKFKDRPLLSVPGERCYYSSFGWNLLAAVIQRAAGMDFLEYMQREVFEPVGMTHTEADRSDVRIPQRSCFYEIEPDGGVVDAPAVDNSDLWAAGGFLSTAEDLVRFGDAILQGSLLMPATVDVLWEIRKTASGEETGYGLGWRWSPLKGHRQVGHDGSHVGCTGRLTIFPDDDLVLAILTNANSRELSATLERIALRMLN
jgi:CubicO group peptidase (beta-lactamase class C family)